MVSLPEVQAGIADLINLGVEYDSKTADAVEGLTKVQAIKVAKQIAANYRDDMHSIVNDTLTEAAAAASESFEGDLSGEDFTNFVNKKKAEKYFGLTLAGRMAVNHVRLRKNIERSAAVGVEHLGSVYTKSYPFGAQVNVDGRTLRATAHKIEQDLAIHYAKERQVKIRWSLSGAHGKPDICDELVGEYTPSNLPRPPHPFCRCEFQLLEEGTEPTKFTRTIDKLRSLIRRLR